MSDKNDNSDQLSLPSLAVAVVALVVALIALAGTTAQMPQQYLSTAVGYSNCSSRVMGGWARYNKLVFHPWELRFEVAFSSPVIAVALRDTAQLSESERPKFILDGTPKSIEDSGIQPLSAYRGARLPSSRSKGAEEKKSVDGAVYPASWLILLSMIQDMEHQTSERLEQEHTLDASLRKCLADVAGFSCSGIAG